MTVGIAVICEREEDPKIVAAADRMVTATMGGSPIEYEHPTSKLHPIEHGDMHGVAITSGSTSIADELYHKIHWGLEATEPGLTAREIAEYAASCYNEILRETAERQVLKPLDMDLDDLKDQQRFQPQFLSALIGDITDRQQQVVANLHALMGAVDATGAYLFQVLEGDFANSTSIGYSAVGSGLQPAQSEFIHAEYDDTCSIEEALRLVVSAKMRSEEAQGVGQKMDMVVIDADGVHEVPEDDVEQLRETQEEIKAEQQSVKENIVEEYEYEWTVH